MTSDEIAMVIAEADKAWHGPNGEPLMNPNQPTDVANYRATLEVAYQLARLNEGLDRMVGPYAMMRVMVEQGDYPLTVKVQSHER